MESESQSNKVPSGPEMVQLFISYRLPEGENCIPLKQPKVKIFTKLGEMERLHGETEACQDTVEVDFKTAFILYYHFERKQHIRLEILSNEQKCWEPISSITTNLGEIIGTKDQTVVFRISSKAGAHGKLVVRVEKVPDNNSTAFIDISARKLSSSSKWFSGGAGSFYYVLNRVVDSEESMEVYKSEVIKKNVNPKWAPFKVSMEALCQNQRDTTLRIQIFCHKYFGFKLFGQCEFTVEELIQLKTTEGVLSKPNKKKKYGFLEVNSFHLGDNPTLADFFRDGFKLNLVMGIDFAPSKGPSNDDSANQDADLRTTLYNVYETLSPYLPDKKAAFYGIAGKPSGCAEPGKNFTLSGNHSDPWISGLERLKGAVNRVTNVDNLAALFEPLIEKAVKQAKQSKATGSKEYTVVVILTKGSIHDVETTLKSLLGCDVLPISILILGIGEKRFDKLELFEKEGFFLPADKVKRPFIHFWKSGNFDSTETMVEESLKEIPSQLLEYMKMSDIKVGPQKKVDVRKILATKKTFKLDDYAGVGSRPPKVGNLLDVKAAPEMRRKSVGNVEIGKQIIFLGELSYLNL